MGFFSWKTADTKESIANVHAQPNQRPVYLLQPKGCEPIKCSVYDGYGVFGGIDAYEWLATMNGMASGGREAGIDLQFEPDSRPTPYIGLKFSYDPKAVWEDLPESEDCPEQGFFY